MFVSVARLSFSIPESGSLKAKRQVVRRISDRVRARFNASVAEVAENDLWQKAVIALAVVGNERRHVGEQMDKIIHFIDEMYVAPMISRETEIISLGGDLQGSIGSGPDLLPVARGDRSLAEAEGLGDWDEREASDAPPPDLDAVPDLDSARAAARRLRNLRDWERNK